jgi:hypothetical protein
MINNELVNTSFTKDLEIVLANHTPPTLGRGFSANLITNMPIKSAGERDTNSEIPKGKCTTRGFALNST